MTGPVLLLNQNYEPLNVCITRRAVVLLAKGKAEILERHAHSIQTCRQYFPRPAVIRMLYQVQRPRPVAKLCRREIFIRDAYTCQYCSARTDDLTVDHVIPRRLGGTRCWENLVTACRHCNLRKGSRTPRGADMRLARMPERPRMSMHHRILQLATGRLHPTWEPYLSGVERIVSRRRAPALRSA